MDRYLIEGMLGSGGMGEVYKARDKQLSIDIALKALRFDVGVRTGALERLKREVILARLVRHPNVCAVYDIGFHEEATGGLWFLTMELLQGESLRERLQRCGRLEPEEALPLVEQIAAGLDAAHRAGVVHRDFKSGNVMLVEDEEGERAVVVDFGLARALAPVIDTDVTEDGVVPGTRAYVAPEQLIGEKAQPASDIYALGVVLYEMVTGRLPFGGISAASKKVRQDAPSPRHVVADLDDRWEAVILRCLSRKPEDRFAYVAEVVDALLGRSPFQVRHVLPPEHDAFVGRENELKDIRELLLSGIRLLTLTGAPGIGKTRLALRAAWLNREVWPKGVFFCDLTEARNKDDIALAVAGSIGVPLGKGDSVIQLGHIIASWGRCLVVLDNFEQCVGHAADTVGRWLERTKEAQFMITSRERLSLRGEAQLAVNPLISESGVELFVERALSQRPGFDPKAAELDSVRDVVRLAEGIPLAIELAAARVRIMAVREIAQRMQKRFHLLRVAGSGRHSSVSATIDVSWELLHEWEKTAWAQCSVFEGGFTLEAAEEVLDLSAWPEAPWVVDVVQSLLDKSLLRILRIERESGAVQPEARFGMFVSLQEYARKKLQQDGAVPRGAAGPEAECAMETRHGTWYARYGTEDAIEALDEQAGAERLHHLQHEIENLIVACRRAVVRGDQEVAVVTYRAAWGVLELRGRFGVAVELGQQILTGRLGEHERALTLMTLGKAEWRAGRIDNARAHLEAALAIHCATGVKRHTATVLDGLGVLDFEQGRPEARKRYEEALEIAREVGNRRLEGVILGNQGLLDSKEGRKEDARAHLEAALAIHRMTGARRLEAIVIGNLGILDFEQGRPEARKRYEEALEIAREVGNRRLEGEILGNLASLHIEQGRVEEGRVHYEAALAVLREVGNRKHEGIALGNVATAYREQGEMEKAEAYYDGALATAREVGSGSDEGIVLSNLAKLRLEQGQMDGARAYCGKALTILRKVGNRSEEGIVLCTLGNVLCEQGIPDARIHYETALAIAREFGNSDLEGVVLAHLASLYAQEGRMAEARDAVTQAQVLLQEFIASTHGLREVHRAIGELLCVRADLERRSGDVRSARATLAKAESRARHIFASPDSHLGKQISRLRQALG